MMHIERYIPPLLGVQLADGKIGKQFIPSYFDKKPEIEEPPPPPPPPTFSEEELKQAEQAAYKRGFADGDKEGQLIAQSELAKLDRKICDALDPIARSIIQLFSEYNQFILTQKAQLPKLALAIARKVAGGALQENALVKIEEMVTESIHHLLGEASVVVSVHASLALKLEERLLQYFAGNQEPGQIFIEGDPDMPIADCRMEWMKGSLIRNTEGLWQEMDKIVDSVIAGTLHEHVKLNSDFIATPMEPPPITTTSPETPPNTQEPL